MLFAGTITPDALGLNIRLTAIFPKKEIYFQLLHQTHPSRREEITASQPFWVISSVHLGRGKAARRVEIDLTSSLTFMWPIPTDKARVNTTI